MRSHDPSAPVEARERVAAATRLTGGPIPPAAGTSAVELEEGAP
ncbi:hypothetical protein [Microbispora sp. NPDC046933]